MKEEDRLSMVAHHREKSIHLLSQGDEMIQLFHWDLAINRYYYACFHIVHSLFISKGITAHSHGGTLSQFTLHFVKSGLNLELHFLHDSSPLPKETNTFSHFSFFFPFLFFFFKFSSYLCPVITTKVEAKWGEKRPAKHF